ncbi:MAG: hypothetical protein ACOC1X_04765 [Promethearchaeota archaeon]
MTGEYGPGESGFEVDAAVFKGLASGIYIYRIRAENEEGKETRGGIGKIIILR